MGSRLLSFVLLGTFCAAAVAQDASQFKPRFWKDVPDQADVMAATFLGGKGHEWLVSGGIQSDGTVVVVGNVLGPTLELAVPVKVIGTDLAAPPEPKPVPQMVGNKPRLDKDGKPMFEKPSWRHNGVTGFVVRLTPDLKKIISAQRLPWTSGAITSAAVDKNGAIYIAGRATDNIAKLGGQLEEQPVAPEAARKDGQCEQAFLAKLSADASKAEWVRHQKGFTDAPHVIANADGSIRFNAQDSRTYDAGGKVQKTVIVPGGVRKTTSISPVDGTIVTSGEHHSGTGREPWRCPTLNIHEPNGKLKYQLYDWGGPMVGLDNSRLVSDTAVRFATHDSKGNIIIYAWSDGGNSVMTKHPNDVHKSVASKGLGINAARAGVLSCAYLVRIDPKTCQTVDSTIWLAFDSTLKPNSCWIDNMTQSENGSIVAVGRCALGLWQTTNKLTDALPTGEYVAVFKPDMSGMRFASVVPGTGIAEVSYTNAGWGVFTGKVDGKERALFVGSAVKESKSGDQTVPTPTVNAGQDKFGGGDSDGYIVMLDLSKAAPPPAVEEKIEKAVGGPTTASFERGANSKSAKPTLPADDSVFLFKADLPKWVTVDAEFRDRAGKSWPSFLYGKPIDGKTTLKNGKLDGSITVACTNAPQTRGEQSQKVIGPLYAEGVPPTFKLTIHSLGELTKAEIPTTDNKGKQSVKVVEYCLAKGTLELGEKKIEVTPKITYSFGKTSGVYKGPGNITPPTDSVRLNAWLTLKGSELGLKDDGLIDLRIGMSGIAPPPDKK